MKTALAIGLALGLGFAATGFAFDGDALNSKKALLTPSKMEMKEKKIETTTVASKEKAAPEKKVTVAITRDTQIGADDRDLGKTEKFSQDSKKALLGIK